MPIGFQNLDAKLKAKINGGLPDIGQVYYMVDSDFRTAAQGWSKADRTGPLDLWAGQNNQGTEYVYRTGDYTDDATALQAAMDQAVDFRGDIIHFTSGAYSLGTVITVDVPNIRLLGPPTRSKKRAAATLTGTVADTLTVSVDDVEMGFLRFVPLTATAVISISTGADGGYVHDFHYDSAGVGASTSTEFVDADDTTKDWIFENGYLEVDATQGDCFTLDGAVAWEIRDCTFLTRVASYATVFTLGTNCEGVLVTNCHFLADADGTYTNIFTGETNSDQQLFVTYCIFSGTAISSLDAIETGFGTTQDIEIAENYQTGDATTETGVVWDLA